MEKWLLTVGLVLIPYYEILIRFLPFVGVDAPDSRQPKEFLALWLALIIGLVSIFNGNFKVFKNKWLLVFVGFTLLSIRLAPKMPLILFDQHNRVIEFNLPDSINIWVWKPVFIILCYLLMLVAISNLSITKKDFKFILTIMAFSGFIMSIYVLLQKIGIDQFWVTKGYDQIGSPTNPELVGNLANPTLVAAYIAMLIPLSLYIKRYFFSIVMIGTVFLINSQMAYGAMIISLLVYFIFSVDFIKKPIVIILIALIFFGVCGYIYFMKPDFIIDDGARFNEWKMIIKNLLSVPEGRKVNYAMFGMGPGSFIHTYTHTTPNSTFLQAHNEYLDVMYAFGIVGKFLFAMAFWTFITSFIKKYVNSYYEKRILLALGCSFLCISLNALGCFVWQISTLSFNSIVILGLIYNIIQREEIFNV